MGIIQHGFKSEAHQFTISESADIFDMMSDALYSDRFRAIVRELSTNAVDAHIEADNMVPFHVHLPTDKEPSFWIRDFGIGLSPEDIKQIYCSYFESTKRTENKLTGQFGLGSKTPLAYVNSFTVTSYFNGQRTRWIVRRNDRIPEIYEEQQSSRTDQHNGLKIQFAVPPKDHSKFYTAAREVYPYFDLQPEFIDCKFTIEKPVYTLSNKRGQACNWGISKDRTSRVIMGGVAYELSDEFDLYQIDLYVPNGSFKMTPSRESLRYIDDTKKRIHGLIEAASIEAHQMLDEQYKRDFNTLFEKTKWLTSISESDSSICRSWTRKADHEHIQALRKWSSDRLIRFALVGHYINIFQNNDKIKHEQKEIVDQKIRDGIYNIDPQTDPSAYRQAIHDEPFEFVFLRHLTRNRSGNYKFKEEDCIIYEFNSSTGQNDITLIVHDGTVKKRIHAITNAYRVNTNRDIYLLNVHDPQYIEDIKDFGLPCEVKLLSELPVPPPEQRLKKPQDPNHVVVPRSVGCFIYNENAMKYQTHNDLTGIKYFIPLKTEGNSIIQTAGLNSVQRRLLDDLLRIIRSSRNEIIYIKEQYLDRYTYLHNFFDYVKVFFAMQLANDKKLAEATVLGYYASTYTNWNFRRVCESLREVTMCEYNKTLTASEKPAINLEILKHPIFASWVGLGVNTIQQGINKFSEYYRIIESYCPDVLTPYDKEFQKKLREFREEFPYLFFDPHQMVQYAFGLKVNPWETK